MIVLAVPDLHCPYHHKDAWDFLRDLKKEYKPDKVVCLGDEAEFAGIGFHEINPNMPSPGDELAATVRELKRGLYKIFPKLDLCLSNHTSRPFRRAMKYGLPSQFIRDYRDFLEAPKAYRWADSFEYDKVLFLHGEGFMGKNGHIKAAMDHRQSCVIGHLHGWAGVQYLRSRMGQIFGCNSGCLIDETALAFRWARHFATKVNLGASVIIYGVEARFIPMKI